MLKLQKLSLLGISTSSKLLLAVAATSAVEINSRHFWGKNSLQKNSSNHKDQIKLESEKNKEKMSQRSIM